MRPVLDALTHCRRALLTAGAEPQQHLRRAIACLEIAAEEWHELNARTHYLTEAHRHVRLAREYPGSGETVVVAGVVPHARIADGSLYGKHMREAA